MSDIFIKAADGTWKKATNIFIRLASTAWQAASSIFLRINTVDWIKVWPLSGIFSTRNPWIGPNSDTVYADRLTSSSKVRIGSNYYGNNAQWNLNGWTVTSYSYAWKYYDQNNTSLGTLDSGTGSGWTSGGTGQDLLPTSIWTSTVSTNTDRQYLGFEVTANATNSVYSGTSVSTRVQIIRRIPINNLTSLSTNSPAVGTQVSYSSTWDTSEARKAESARTTIQWYKNSVSSTSGGTFLASGSTYTPQSSDSGFYLYVIETRFNSGTDYDLGPSTGVSASVVTTNPVTSGPGSPTGLTATNVGSGRSYNDGRIDLSWTAPSNNGGSAITGYRIERSTDGSTFSVLVANTGSTSTSYSNTGLTSGQIYYYRVYAINSGGTGSVSNTANATATTIPQAPTIGTASRVSNTQASIGFTLNNNGGAAVTSLIVASSPTVSLSYSGTSSPVTVTGTFTLNQGYTFTVRAVNTNGSSFTSASSNQITINQAAVPTAPTNLQRSTGSGFSKTFTWSAPTSNGGSAITGYEYSVDGGSSWLPTSSSSSQSYTYSVAGSVSFSVRANNAAGAGAAATTTFTIPTVTTPTASSVTSTSATVSWTSTGQNNYSLTGVGPNSPYTGTTATSVNVTGLSAATSYSPVVTITSPTSDTVVSSAGTFTTGGGTVAPSNVQVTVTSSGFQGEFIPGSTLTASYTASGTTPFTSVSYQWARSTNNSTWSNVGTNSSTLATNSTYNNYYVRCTVTVTNSAGSASGTSPSYFMSDAI